MRAQVLVLPEDAIDITFDCFRSGIYFLIDKGRILYIGQSSDVMQRIVAHRQKKDIKFTRVAFLSEPNKATRLELEANLIATYDPPFNTQKSTGEIFTREEARAELKKIGLID